LYQILSSQYSILFCHLVFYFVKRLLEKYKISLYNIYFIFLCRSHWPSGLRRGSAAARLLGLRVRIPPRTWMFFCYKCCVLSGRGLCYGPIPRPEESYRLWPFIVCDQMNNNPQHLTWLGKKNLD
jgi:hypothetical protein